MKTFANVKNGTSGTYVYILQALLRASRFLGADGKPLEIDGKAGENTVHAIEQFKTVAKAYGYDCSSDGEGVFGSASWKHMLGV